MKWRMVDLFSGLAGFSLAASWVWGDDLEIVAFCEIDKRCQDFLRKHHPDVPIIPDVRDLDGEQFRPVDLVCAGVPCQPASRAGKQRGKEDDRWLWPEAMRVIRQSKPTWAVLENPPGIGDVGLSGILSDLETQGYERRVFGIPACAIGSPQIRERYFIVAYRNQGGSEDGQCVRQDVSRGDREWGGTADNLPASAECGTGDMAHRFEPRLEGGEGQRRDDEPEQPTAERGLNGNMANPKRRQDNSRGNGDLEEEAGGREGGNPTVGSRGEIEMGDSQCADGRRWREQGGSAPETCCGDNRSGPWGNYLWLPCADGKVRRAPNDSFGLVDGLHRSVLTALGNSIVPQVVAEIFRAIKIVEGGNQ